MKDGLLDWDCAESINIADMERALSHIRAEGTFPVSNNQTAATASTLACLHTLLLLPFLDPRHSPLWTPKRTKTLWDSAQPLRRR